MSIADTNKQLKSLRDELASLKEAELHLQAKIDGLLDQLNEELQQRQSEPDNNDSEEHPPSLEDITELVRKFEVEHPALTDSVNRVLMTLSNMGI